MRRLVLELVDDFRRQSKAERWLLSVLLLGIAGYALTVIALWSLT